MRFTSTTIISLILTFFILSSCSVHQNSDEPIVVEGEQIPFTTIGAGALFGGGQEGFSETETTLHVLRTAEEWATFKAKMNTANQITGSFKDTDLDFESEMVIAIVDKLRGSGGYDIKIAEIGELKDALQVWVKRSSPSDMAASVLTQPFHIIRVSNTKRTAVWNELEEEF